MMQAVEQMRLNACRSTLTIPCLLVVLKLLRDQLHSQLQRKVGKEKTIRSTRLMYGERKRNFVGQHFWARGYFVSTVGRDEAVIREYIKNQEKEDERLDQLGLWK